MITEKQKLEVRIAQLNDLADALDDEDTANRLRVHIAKLQAELLQMK